MSKIDAEHHLALELLLAEAAFAGLEGRIAIELPSAPLVVAARDKLIRMKQLAGRAQDLADLEKLEAGDDA